MSSLSPSLALKKTCAQAPGKLILSGEHAVVHGAPAIATAIQLYASTTITPHAPHDFVFNLVNLAKHHRRTRSRLSRLRRRLQRNYDAFVAGHLPIKEVLKKPFELVEYTASHFLEKVQRHRQGINIQHDSQLPSGCGMGSSAATIVATHFALMHYFNQPMDLNVLQQEALRAENLQHGQSSGVDIYLSIHGGCHVFQQGQQTKSLQLPETGLFWVNTGAPNCTTGECVTHTKRVFSQTPDLLQKFEQTTQAFTETLTQANLGATSLFPLIQQNHGLLCQIGVVPQKIQQFAQSIENLGGAAKICGAGAISGDKAGVMLIAGDQDKLKPAASQWGYTLHPLRMAQAGVHLI